MSPPLVHAFIFPLLVLPSSQAFGFVPRLGRRLSASSVKAVNPILSRVHHLSNSRPSADRSVALFTLRLPEVDKPPQDPGPDSAVHFIDWLLNWNTGDHLPEIRAPLVLNTAWAVAVHYLHQQGLLPPLDGTAHSLLSGALGFFLTLRANEGYSRCNEARQVWDSVLNVSRDIVRAAIAAEPLMGQHYTQRMIDLTCAFGMALEEYVCGKPRSKELDAVLDDADMAALDKASNRPLTVVDLMAVEICRMGRDCPDLATSVHYARLLTFVDTISHEVTTCQRLMRSSVPPIFYGHAMRFLTLWTFSLPLVLVQKMPLANLLPAVAFVTWALYGLRELGVKAQYPFQIGIVSLRALWREMVWDARAAYRAARAAVQAKEDEDEAAAAAAAAASWPPVVQTGC